MQSFPDCLVSGYRDICYKIDGFLETAAFVASGRYDDGASELADLSVTRVSVRLIGRMTSYQVMLSASVVDVAIRHFLNFFCNGCCLTHVCVY